MICIILFFALYNVSEAQSISSQQQEKWQLSAGIVASQSNVIDKSFSSLPYTGINAGAFLSLQYRQNKSFHELDAFYSGGSLKTSGNFSQLKNIYLNIDYANVYAIGPANRSLKFCGGGGINVLYAQRDYNNFVNNNNSFEFATSLSAVFEISYLFNNTFSISDRLIVPVVSAVVQPDYGDDVKSNSFFSSMHMLSFSSFLRVKNNLRVDMNFAPRHNLGLGYSWDYYQLKDIRDVKYANHELMLIYSYLF